jgi:LmbE family N-acetylglucosaminyl deacetylase
MLDFAGRTALVLAPHPDDEVFGCGGFIHALKRRGGRVFVLYMTYGTTVHFGSGGSSSGDERRVEVDAAVERLGVDGFDFAFPGDDFHLRLDRVPQRDLVHAIERGPKVSLQELRPDIVLTPSNNDYNQDHRAVSNATMTALRPAAPDYRAMQSLVLAYELPYHQWQTTEASTVPAFCVRLEREDLDAKIEALQLYGSQLKSATSPLSVHGVETLAAFRGLQCGAAYAEGFFLKRLVA